MRNRYIRAFAMSCALGFALSISIEAHAQEGARLPLRFVDRPLNLPAATLRVDGEFGFTGIKGGQDLLNFNTGIAAGFTDDVEIGAALIPLQLAPTFEYLNPLLYGQYRFVRGPVEVAVRAAANIPVKAGFLFSAGLPILIHFGSMFRLDTGAFLDIHASDPIYGDSATMRAPGALSIQVDPHWFLGPEIELAVDLGSANRGRLPLGFFTGYTVANSSGGPLADFRVRLRSEDIGQGIDQWSVFAIANLFIFL